MISVKKSLYAFAFGLGVSFSLAAWAAPGCSSCLSIANQCLAGVQSSCRFYYNAGCVETLAACGISDPLDV